VQSSILLGMQVRAKVIASSLRPVEPPLDSRYLGGHHPDGAMMMGVGGW